MRRMQHPFGNISAKNAEPEFNHKEIQNQIERPPTKWVTCSLQKCQGQERQRKIENRLKKTQVAQKPDTNQEL